MMHLHLNECDSTQDVLKEQLRNTDLSHPILVSCENQLKGRGRGDHDWSALPDTVCLSLTLNAHAVPSFTAIEVSVLVARFFETKNRTLRLKWPNDLFTFTEKKCGGILVQSSGPAMLAGIGLNLYSDHSLFGGVYETKFEVDKKKWSEEIALFILNNRYSESQSLKHDWEQRCFHMNQPVEVEEAGQRVSGIFRGLGQYGEAILETAQGMVSLFNGSLRKSTSR